MKNNVLAQGLNWFIRLRWFAATAILFAAILFRQEPTLFLHLVCVSLSVFVYNLVFIWGKMRKNWGDKIFAHFQIILDWLALGTLSYLLGKEGILLIPFFIFHVIIASVLLDRAESYAHTTLAILMALALWTGTGVGSFLSQNNWTFSFAEFQLPISFLVLAFTFYTTAYLAGTIGKMLKQREIKLESAYEKLEAEDQEKTWFLLTATHSLKSPLSTMESMLQSLLYTAPERIEQKTKETLEKVLSRMAQLSQIVKELLCLAEARQTKTEPARPLLIAEIMKKTVENLKRKAAEKSIALNLDITTYFAKIEGYPQEWERVFENLIENAIQYSPSGKTIIIHISEKEGKLICSIQDSGIGIAKEDIEKVFGEFYRAANARAFAENGTGLGLPIVKRIVEKWGGTIRIESELSKGTKVMISVPLWEKGGD